MFWAIWSSSVQHKAPCGANRSPQSPCPTPLQKRAPASEGGGAGPSAVAVQPPEPQPPEPQRPLLPGPAPHMGIVMLQQPGSQATHQHFYGGGRGRGRGKPRGKRAGNQSPSHQNPRGPCCRGLPLTWALSCCSSPEARPPTSTFMVGAGAGAGASHVGRGQESRRRTLKSDLFFLFSFLLAFKFKLIMLLLLLLLLLLLHGWLHFKPQYGWRALLL